MGDKEDSQQSQTKECLSSSERQPDSSVINFIDFTTEAQNDNCSRLPYFRPILCTDRQQCYESKTHSSQAMLEMYRFYQAGRLCDVVLSSSNCKVKIPCHKLVLAASSLYFDRMFAGDLSESQAPEVNLKNVSGTVLKRLIEYSYTSKLVVDADIVFDMFEAADMFQFVEMRLFCQDFLLNEVTTQNCLRFLLYADLFSSRLLYQHALSIAAQEFQSIRLTSEFLDLPFEHVKKLLAIDTMEVEYEEYVFEAFKSWISHDSSSRSVHMVELFQSVRLNFVSRWYLIEIISKDAFISSSPECMAIIQRAKDQLLALGHTYETSWQLPTSRKQTGLTWKIIYVNTFDPQPGESQVFLFDPVNKSWSSTNRACPLASELSSCCCVGNSLLVIGGWTNSCGTKSMNMKGAVNTIHEFKVMSIFPTLWYVGSFSMQAHRYLHSSVAYGNKVFVVGGCDESQKPQCTVFAIDVTNNYKFEVWPRMSHRLYRPACSVWCDRLYVFGGVLPGGESLQRVQCFDFEQCMWVAEIGFSGGFPPQRYVTCHYACTVGDWIYVVCGLAACCESRLHPTVNQSLAVRKVDSILRFCPQLMKFLEMFSLPETREGAFCVTQMQEKIYITGGQRSNGQYCNTIECFDTSTSSWEIAGSSREGRGDLSLSTAMRVMHENFGF